MIVDLFIVLLVTIFTIIGLKRGFIKEFISLFCVVIALFIAFTLSNYLSRPVYTSVIEPNVYKSIYTDVENTVSETVVSKETAFANTLPDSVITLANRFGLNDAIDGKFQSNEAVDVACTRMTDSNMKKIVNPIGIKICSVILFIIIFVISIISLKLVATALNLIAKLPLLRNVNSKLGAVLGFIKGTVISLSITYCLYLCLCVVQNNALSNFLKQFSDSLILGIIV